jgi:L-alanine-DL-glutamate epimerase-like enolase superfamily enzyme
VQITGVETLHLRLDAVQQVANGTQDALVVFVHTDAGIVGVGEADSSPTVVRAVIEAQSSHSLSHGLASLLVGQDPLEVERLWQRMYDGSIYFGRRGAVIHALSALDMALWDIRGRAWGVPVWKLLGGAVRERVPAYASVLMPDTPEAARLRAESLRERGFRAAKFGWGPLGRDAELDVELAAAVREGLGPDAKLMLDIGLRWDAATAVRMVQSLQPYDPFWIEEPLSPDDYTGYRRLCDAVDTRIAAGEEETTRFGFLDLLERGGVDVVQPDLSRAGGFTECRRIAQLAADHGVWCVPHAFSTPILLAASLHFVAATPNAPLLEYCEDASALGTELCPERFPLGPDGCVGLPSAPGLGVTLDQETVRRYRVP